VPAGEGIAVIVGEMISDAPNAGVGVVGEMVSEALGEGVGVVGEIVSDAPSVGVAVRGARVTAPGGVGDAMSDGVAVVWSAMPAVAIGTFATETRAMAATRAKRVQRRSGLGPIVDFIRILSSGASLADLLRMKAHTWSTSSRIPIGFLLMAPGSMFNNAQRRIRSCVIVHE
jgi:hypothetical protein